MSVQQGQKPQAKTYIKGSFLYSTDGLDYEQGHKQAQQKIIEDKANMLSYPKLIQMRKNVQNAKRKNPHKNQQKQPLIPIRDTPVQPVPQPLLQNQRCQRATQEQYQYFQFYISQKQKEKQFEEEQDRDIKQFLEKQERQKEKQHTPRVSLVMQKQQQNKEIPKKVVKNFIKIKVSKKTQDQKGKIISKKQQDLQSLEKTTKIRILSD